MKNNDKIASHLQGGDNAPQDDFLRDAVEGYSQNNVDPSSIYGRYGQAGKSTFTFSMISMVIVISLTVSVSLFYDEHDSTISSKQELDTSISSHSRSNQSDQLTNITDSLPSVYVKNLAVEMKEVTSLNENKLQSVKEEQVDSTFSYVRQGGSISPIAPSTIPAIVTSINSELSKPKLPLLFTHGFKIADYRGTRFAKKPNTEELLSGTNASNETHTSNEVVSGSTPKTSDITYANYIDAIMAKMSTSNYERAKKEFKDILVVYPDDINALFYSGLISYQQGQYEESIEFFNKVLRHKYANFNEEALWLKAECFRLLNRTSESKKEYRSIIQSGGYYSEKAKEKLQELSL